MCECKIAEKLVQFRLAKGVTQDELAQNLSISNKTVSKWENGASMPDLPMLVELAKYFDVPADALLDLSNDKANDTKEAVRSVIEGSGWKASILKAFEMERALIPALYNAASSCEDEETDGVYAYPSEYSDSYRSQIVTPELFQLTASSENVNFSVSLLQNKNNFAWLNDPKKQQAIVRFFRFLSAEDALSVLYFIHSTDCPQTFTAGYVSTHTGVPEERASVILKQFCGVGGCSSLTAHLAEGDMDIYECAGDGTVLSVLALAYDKMCGKACYEYNFNSECKMIGGK